jgi:hypothetical protein
MLIKRSDIEKYRQVSKGKDDQIINHSIQDAEITLLKPLLGELLYNDLVRNESENRYQMLLERTEYNYNGNWYVSDGIKAVLAHFTYSKYILLHSEVDTPFGVVQKSSQYSTPSDLNTKKSMSKLAEQTAYEYFKSVRDYLNRHKEDYPLWKNCNGSRNFKFNKIV